MENICVDLDFDNVFNGRMILYTYQYRQELIIWIMDIFE